MNKKIRITLLLVLGLTSIILPLVTVEAATNKKIAVFFWDNDATSDSSVNMWSGWMENYRGYEIRKHRQSTNWQADMDALDAEESTNDQIFIFIGGHGSYQGSSDVSEVVLKRWWIFRYAIRSDSFRAKIMNLESQRITVVVSSCHSGDFEHELASVSGVTVLASCRENELSYPNFASSFFDEFVGLGHSISESFAYTYAVCSNYGSRSYHPQIDYGAVNYNYA